MSEQILSLVSYLEFAAGFQGLFLLLVIVLLSRLNLSAKLLAFLILSISIFLLWSAVHDSRLLEEVPYLILIGPICLLTIAPLLFLYTESVNHENFSLQPRAYLHFLPAVLFLLFNYSFLAASLSEQTQIVTEHYRNHEHGKLQTLIPAIQLLTYTGLIIWRVSSLKIAVNKSIRTSRLLYISTTLVIVTIFFVIINVASSLQLGGSVFVLILGVMVFYLTYQEIKLPAFLQIVEKEPATNVNSDHGSLSITPTDVSTSKYVKSSLPENHFSYFGQKLERVMQDEKLYRKNDLALKELADAISLPHYHLSQLLNQHLKVSFYDYINRYRVEEVKLVMTEERNKKLSIISMAYDAGFNSKASFNNAFKKHTGATPTQYRKSRLLSKVTS